jgi:hypothetical protein
MWDTPDGRFHEHVDISFYKQSVPGELLGLKIGYFGPDEKLMMPRPEAPNWRLTLAYPSHKHPSAGGNELLSQSVIGYVRA